MNKKKIVLTISVILFLLILVGVFYYLKFDNKKEDNKDENKSQVVENQNKFDGIKVADAKYKVTYEKKDKVIYFYKDGVEANKYSCDGNGCNVLDSDTYANKIVIYDDILTNSSSDSGKKIVFFDIDKGVLNTYMNYLVSIRKMGDSYIYLGSSEDKSKDLIVNYSGEIIKSAKNKNFVLTCYEGCYIEDGYYDIDSDYIVTVNNNKYGIEKLTSDEVILDNIYEDIAFNDSNKFVKSSAETGTKMDNDGKTYYEKLKYVKLKLNNKWYLYDLANKKNVIDTPYDEIILISDKVVMIYNNNEIYFVDYNGKKIDDNVIKTTKLNPAFVKPTFNEEFSIEVKNNILEFSICDGDITDKYECLSNNNLIKTYRYDINNKKLESISK